MLDLPPLASRPVDRRALLRLSAAGLAMAGLGGCDPSSGDEAGHLVPAVVQPPEIVPGLPNRYATAHVGPGGAIGIVVTHQMGRPIKVEGNPAHPASLGATDVTAQAALLDFYDPGRAGTILHDNTPAGWTALSRALAERRAAWAQTGGEGLRLLVEDAGSPTLMRLLGDLRAAYSHARVESWDPLSHHARAGAALAYGTPVDVLPRPGQADVIVAFDSDLIATAPGHLAHARAVAARRNPVRGARMSRIYAIEPSPTLIGIKADHRIPAEPAAILAMLRELCAGIGGASVTDPRVAAMLSDLRAAPGAGLIHAGADLPAAAIAAVHAANEALGGRGLTFDVVAPADTLPAADMAALVADMQAGRVTDLVVLGVNPAYAGPDGFAEALGRVGFSLVLAPSPNETSRAAHWFVPQTHPWESWGDVRAHDGSVTLMQPQALPLYGGTAPLTLVSLLMRPDAPPTREMVRATWAMADDSWQASLADGLVLGTASVRSDATIGANLPPIPTQAPSVLLRPDPHLWDGRWADNAWLQECPRPISKLVWDNPLLISPARALQENLVNGAEVTLQAGARSVTAPVWIMPGQAPETIVGLRGHGRRVVGEIGAGSGWDLSGLADTSTPWRLTPTGRQIALASSDHHDIFDASPDTVVRRIALADIPSATTRAAGGQGQAAEPTLYHPPAPERAPSRPAWGMSIDLNACIGCNACVVACQAENNVPVVGRDEVLRQREMHWLRIDRYVAGPADNPELLFEPMLCQHCEEAPCEIVCPVEATVHDSEGLNVMVYNRCIGTRFCSNNCPYKVRRFNWGAYAREEIQRPPIARNPDVSARGRGVMEKCTFCVQRIAAARIAADLGDRPIADGEVVTACQAACPTQAYSFGDVRDPASEVTGRQHSPISFRVLEDQATRPRIAYEAVVRNPNPAFPA